MTINGVGTVFMLWWITMGVVVGLWSLINGKKQAEELYKSSYSFMTFEDFKKLVIIVGLIIWPIALLYDIGVTIKKLVRKIKRGF